MGRARRPFDPVGNYHFSVELDGIVVGECDKVEGLSYEVELIEYRVSDQPMLPRYRPGSAKYGSVSLKGGHVESWEFCDWLARCQAGIYERKDLTINVYDNAGGGVVAWHLYRCLPTKWSASSLEGKGNEAFFDSLELRVEEGQRVKATPLRAGAQPRVVVTRESPTGRNLEFRDTVTGREMDREEFVDAIRDGTYADDYQVRQVNGLATPAAKPNDTTADNLG